MIDILNKQKQFEIVPTEAEIVREIFRLYLDGWGYKKIANHLTDTGVPTPRMSEQLAEGPAQSPRAVCLTATDDGLYLLAGVRHRHFVDKKLKLNFQPVIVVWKVNVVSDGDDTHAGVPQILQFHQPAGIAAGGTGKGSVNKEDI